MTIFSKDFGRAWPLWPPLATPMRGCAKVCVAPCFPYNKNEKSLHHLKQKTQSAIIFSLATTSGPETRHTIYVA